MAVLTVHRRAFFAPTVHWRNPVVYASIVLVSALLSLARLPAPAIGTLWAEDGGIFINDVLKDAGLRGIFAPYQGYLHVVPRGVAWLVVRLLPVDAWAIAVTVAACLIVGGVAALVFHCSSVLSRNVWVRLGFAAVPVLVAASPEEALGNLANLHWYFLYLAPWLLLKRPRTWVEGAVLTVAALLVGLTEIQAAVFVPLFAYRLRDARLWGPRLALLAGVGAQVFTTLAYPRENPAAPPVNWLSVVYGWFVDGPSAVMFGTAGQISRVVVRFGWVPVALAAALFLAASAVILVRGRIREKVAAGAFLGGSLVIACAAVALNFRPFLDYAAFDDAGWNALHLGRYAVAPSMFLLALLPLLGEVLGGSARPALLGILAVLMVVYFFPVAVGREFGPIWTDHLEQARAACRTPGAEPEQIVPIAPTDWPIKGVKVPCRILG
ncbi:hypothetical protein [Arthrobacter methylotrophus]|uniref:DUF2029 domain-containing protein n=1 Tax=Arthrobacter methylotrophus TaxID=121291 RepID=A0ABV5URH3_9MICC